MIGVEKGCQPEKNLGVLTSEHPVKILPRSEHTNASYTLTKIGNVGFETGCIKWKSPFSLSLHDRPDWLAC